MNNVKIEYNKMRYLFDKDLSLKAKGFMALCIAYINSAQGVTTFRLKDLEEFCKESRTATYSTINELSEKGYIVRTKAIYPSKQGISWEFTFLE